ncbi:MAG: LPP20 family lipoprotein, partial [Bacteroidia bacterium]|nr:LPP20 family lipoprotein [Bacteroidia bacterium]
MNLKKTGILLGILLITSISGRLAAQSISDIKSDRQTYIWGEGMGETLKAADQAALVEIIGQISVQVESNFEMKTTENGKDFAQTVNDVIKTYTSATLKNTERIVLENEPDAKVFRYIRRSELTKIFESRKNKIRDFAQSGESALKNLQVADALRYLYWSQTLLRSHPEANDIDMMDLSGKKVLLITWLPKQI